MAKMTMEYKDFKMFSALTMLISLTWPTNCKVKLNTFLMF